MLGALLAASLAAAPQVAAPKVDVLVARRTAVPPERAASIARQVQASLLAAGMAAPGTDELTAQLRALGYRDALGCRGARPCLVELGRRLGGAAVVAVTAGAVRGDLAVALELYRASDGARLAQHSFVVPMRAAERLESQLAPFIAAVAAAFPLPSKAPEEAPREVAPPPPPPNLTPKPDLAPPPELPPVSVSTAAPAPPGSPSRVPALIATGGALASAGAGGFLLFLALDEQHQLDTARRPLGSGYSSDFTEADAMARRDRANLEASLALGSAVLSAALTSAAILLWSEPAR